MKRAKETVMPPLPVIRDLKRLYPWVRVIAMGGPGAGAGGGDADTNGAVAGALLGARYGLPGLPRTWPSRLQDRDAIEAEAKGLVPLAELADR